MAERIDLGDGEWVVFRDVTVMTNRQRSPYLDLLMRMRKKTWSPDTDARSAFEWGCATTFMLIAEWSRPEPIPTEYDLFVLALDELPALFLDQMTLAASAFLMTPDPPTNRAARRASPAKKAAKRPAKKATKKR